MVDEETFNRVTCCRVVVVFPLCSLVTQIRETAVNVLLYCS